MDIQQLSLIVSEFNECIAGHSLSYAPSLDLNDLKSTEKIITNISASSKLTDIILNNYFSQHSIREYHHFTDIDAFESILKSKTIWLASVEKRFSENEFRSFYQAHKMDGYELRKTNGGMPLENELVKNAFYTSFTNDKLTAKAEEYMWDYFAKEKGVRLVFEINNINADLRKVFYPPNSTRTTIDLLTDLIEIASNHHKLLIIQGIATIGFFYLPHSFDIEQEYRILLKRTTCEYFRFKFSRHPTKRYEYIELPFISGVAELKPKKIVLGEKTDEIRMEQFLKSIPEFSSVLVERSIM